MMNKGAILVTTLWILALLTLLALGIGMRMGLDIKLIGFSLNSSKAYYIAKAGLRKAIWLIDIDPNKRIDALNEPWSCGFDFDEEEYLLKDIVLGEGTFTVKHEFGKDEEGAIIYLYGASDEEGKLNINMMDGDMLLKLPNFSSEIVSAILDWRDGDDQAGNNLIMTEGAEDDYYEEELESPYECKDAAFSVAEELMLVKGVSEEIYNGVKDVITVYGEGKAVNINTASEKVLAIIIGPEFEELPGKIVRYRNGEDKLPGTEDDRIFADAKTIITQLLDPLAAGLEPEEQRHLDFLINNKKYFKCSSSTFRIVSQGKVRGGRVKKTIEAVVKRGRTVGGSGIVHYYED